VVVAIAVAGRGGDEPRGAEACVGEPAEDRCLRELYDGVVAAGAVASTLRDLESLSRDGRLDDCHLQAHRLAHAVYRDVGDVERAFLLGGPQCRLGYLHGAVEASGGSPTFGVPRCTRFRNPVQRRACAHGYGHALMLRTRNDLVASLQGCRAAAGRDIDVPSCQAGVLMENSLRHAGSATLAQDAARGCAAVEDTPALFASCLDNLGVVAALLGGHDGERAAAVCRELEEAQERRACLTGVEDELAEAARGR
jgi:hypothetical protein